MPAMRLNTVIATAIAIATLSTPSLAQGSPPEESSDPLAQIDAIVGDQMGVSHIPGVAIAIVDQGRVMKLSGYGSANLEWNTSVDPDTRFQLASATKLFTAVALMRLVEKGKLELDQPISDFFGKAPDTWDQITVRMLASHTSGLDEDLGQPTPRTVEEAIERVMKRPLAYEPGSEARYGFTDFTVLRAIMENVTGRALPEIFRTEITEPLQMSATGFAMAVEEGPVRTAEVLPKRSSVYSWNGERQRTSDFFFEPLGYGAGGLYSTARDLAQFCVALDSGEFISSASLADLTTPVTLPDGSKAGFGMGWTVKTYRDVPIVGHSGGPALADIIRIPSRGLSIVVLTNQQLFYPLLAERIADLYLPKPIVPNLPDSQPQLTARFKAALENLDQTVVADGSPALEPLRSPFGQAYLMGVGPIEMVDLMSEREVDRVLERHYLVRFERRTAEWIAMTDEEGLLVAVRPK